MLMKFSIKMTMLAAMALTIIAGTDASATPALKSGMGPLRATGMRLMQAPSGETILSGRCMARFGISHQVRHRMRVVGTDATGNVIMDQSAQVTPHRSASQRRSKIGHTPFHLTLGTLPPSITTLTVSAH